LSGIVLVREALETVQGITLVLYVRSPQKLPQDIATHRDVIIVTGQLTDADALSKALEGADAVVSTIGPAVMRGPFHPMGTPLAKAYELLIPIMRAHDVRRLIALGTASIKDPNDKFSYQFYTLIAAIATLAHTAYKDVVAIGDAVQNEGSDLDWTIVRVPVLTDHDCKEFVAGYVGDGLTSMSLSRASFAAFVLNELKENNWVRKAPLLSNAHKPPA
jgi:putative NADH-flavin reductase